MKFRRPEECPEQGRFGVRILKNSKGPLNVELYAPHSFYELAQEAIEVRVGGCGPGKFGDVLVPDTMYGLNIVRACEIHDFMWSDLCDIPQPICDKIFFNNIGRLIRGGSKRKWLILLRLVRSWTYWQAVRLGRKRQR